MKKLFTTLLLVMLLSIFVLPVGVNAAEEDSEVSKTITRTINGTERTLTIYENGRVFFNVSNQEPFRIYLNPVDIQFDQQGAVWIISSDTAIRWWNYDLTPNKKMLQPIVLEDDNYVTNVESFVFDENEEFVIGYKMISDETVYPILTLDEMKSFWGITDDPTPSPSPTVEPTPTPTATPTVTPTVTPTATPTVAPTVAPTVVPTVVPTAVPTVVPTAVPTVEPTAVPTPEPMAKVSIKKKSGFTCLYSGNNLVHKYKLKKGVLTWTGKKTKKFKNIKYAGFIKKSQNVIFMTKSGKVYTLSKTGKKKLVVKNAKKFVCKAKFVVKVKTKTGTTNVSNR